MRTFVEQRVHEGYFLPSKHAFVNRFVKGVKKKENYYVK